MIVFREDDEIDEERSFMHYGVLRRSGRYPYGSGGPENSGVHEFIGYANTLKRQGLSDVEIAQAMGITTTQLRAGRSIAKNLDRQQKINMAQRLRDKGNSPTAIGARMGLNESSVRALLAPGAAAKADVLQATASALKAAVDEKRYIDIGSGVEQYVGVTQSRLKTAVSMLEEEGYKTKYVKVMQLGTGNLTNIKVLVHPDVTSKELWANKENIGQFTTFSEDGGSTYTRIQKPVSIKLSRVGVRYGPEGGSAADGVIYIRPGVKDLSIGGSRYAQVRIAVNGTHYLKGMAVYKEDLPAGVDLLFNTNKKNTGDKLDAMKPMKQDKDGNIDSENPFGSAIKRQIIEHDKDGNPKVTSVMNIVNEEGDWANWSKSLSTQFLSKQNPLLAETQLKMTYEARRNNLDEIKRLTNPAVKRQLLENFADETDSAAVHLKAAALPRQGSHVIMPVASMKDTEVYAPNFKPGERVVLIRYPHGGKFEIPELTVNNKHPEANALLGKDSPGKSGGHAIDAIGISPKTAARLSGADFDGDTVLVIPNNSGRVKSEHPLAGLKNFDPQTAYPAYEGMPKMTSQEKQHQMGLVSNLITDMTIKGANGDELAAAVRHSMVVIDAEKHHLDYKSSAKDNGIPALMAKYQNRSQGGSSTLISRATSEARPLIRKARSAAEGGAIDQVTGERRYTPTGEHYVIPAGSKTTPKGKVVNVPERVVYKTEKSTKLAETTDAHSLSSGTRIEEIYADHSNSLKALANEARLAQINTKSTPYSPSAKVTYAPQYRSLNEALNMAKANAPRERQAQLVANAIMDAKKAAYPNMDKDELKKERGKALVEARIRTGASKTQIEISDKEWEAIQAGAISTNILVQILRNANPERVKQLATPRQALIMTSNKRARAQQMIDSGYTQADVADMLGVSLSTLKRNLEGVDGGG